LMFIAASEAQIKLNCIIDMNGPWSFGQMAAIMLALAPAWALVEMIYRYPETKKGRRAERKRLRKRRLAEAARLGLGRSPPHRNRSPPSVTNGSEALDAPDTAIGGPGIGVRHRDSAGRRQGHASHGSDTSVYGGFSPSPPPLALLPLPPRPARLADGEGELEGDSQGGVYSGVLVTHAPGPMSVSIHRTVELPDVSEQQGQGVKGGNEVSPSILDLNPSDTDGVGPAGYSRLSG